MPGHVLNAEYFYYDTAPNFNKDLAIVCGGHEKCASDFEIYRSNYPFSFIKYTIKGKGTLSSNNKTYQLLPGILSGFCAGVDHRYISDRNDPMEHIFITFLGTEAKSILQKSGLGKGGAVKVQNPEEALSLIENIFLAGIEKQPFSQIICSSYLRILLLKQGTNSLSKEAFSASLNTFRKCKDYINKNFSDDISISDAATSCNINVRYMSSLFKKYADTTPHEYLMKLKLNKAANLLLNSSLTIKKVADLIGFPDPYHFSRNFKKYNGLSPKKYRQLHL